MHVCRSSNHSVVISSSNDHGCPISATPWRYVGLVPCPHGHHPPAIPGARRRGGRARGRRHDRASGRSAVRGGSDTGTRADPFTLGVASVTRGPTASCCGRGSLPNPDDPQSASTSHRYEVAWQVATDERMTSIERDGTAGRVRSGACRAHRGLGSAPGREYWYRFRVGPWMSPIGRTKTAPAAGERPGPLDIVAASCQNWAAGYYTAHRHLAAERPDVVVFLGDYIYEYGIGGDDGGRGNDIVGPRPPRLRDRHARAIPRPVRLVQARPRPTGRSSRRPMGRDVGRPRGGGQLCR